MDYLADYKELLGDTRFLTEFNIYIGSSLGNTQYLAVSQVIRDSV